MKALIFCLAFIFMLSCNQNASDSKLNELQAELEKVTTSLNLESATKNFIENYLNDLQAQDWKNKVMPYMNNPAEFIVEHEKFRTAFSNYQVKIKHLAIDGNEAIMWSVVTAIHSGEFDIGEIKGVKATRKKVEWEEVWQFDVVDGKFGDQFDFMVNRISRMEQLGIKCLP